MKNVDIRFNTNYPTKSLYQWRILIDGVETLVNQIRCEVPTYTTSTFIEGAGMKWHMSCLANEVKVDIITTTNLIAIIK